MSVRFRIRGGEGMSDKNIVEKSYEPPFDGKPCPMCPMEVRNMSAVVHNLALRLNDYSNYPESTCKIIRDFNNLQRAIDSVELPANAPEALKALHSAATDACKSETVADLLRHKEKLKSASLAVRPLSGAHFADRRHAYPG
jgi:hypothetical protein